MLFEADSTFLQFGLNSLEKMSVSHCTGHESVMEHCNFEIANIS